MKHKIVLTCVYFGQWPAWFPAFLASCRENSSIDWLFITDCKVPARLSANLKFVQCSMDELNAKASDKLELEICKHPYSQLDLRPAYGVIFRDLYQGYDFWGHVDLDVVWGDIRKFISDEILANHQIISARERMLAGHFTLWRNDEDTNNLFRDVPSIEKTLSDRRYFHFDEAGMGKYLRTRNDDDVNNQVRIHWPKPRVLSWWELARNASGWKWKDGQLVDGKGIEHMYIHFMTWKRRMKHIDFDVDDSPTEFMVTNRGIWSKPPSSWDRLKINFQVDIWCENQARRLQWALAKRQRRKKGIQPKDMLQRSAS